MDYTDDKLDNFARTVMKEAMDKRVQILEQAKENKKKILEQKELELLKDAYETIQKEVRKASKGKNEMVSRALIEGKKAFLSEREKILAQVFSDIMNKINDFIANAEEYRPFLINTVKEGISKVGEGEITVLINKTDINYEKDIVDEVKNQLNIGVNVAVESAEIIGGCKVWNKSKNTIADFSIKGRIEKEKGEFLKFSGLILD